ncbi:MAG: permease [Deltaproteobacteria bacterium RBG_19FT_COMBO_52_11]|nr:MAG: permease [Deltaproteobacteria bacterium RBG_19FT_COMBO_52_11]
MDITLPIAGMSINVFFLIGLGGGVGFLSGLFGVGGGFLLTPLLIFAGIPPTVAAASDSNQIVAAAASGAYAHSRMGNVDFKMGIILLLGGITGGSIGVQIIKVLMAFGNVDFVIKLIYVIILGTIGTFMFLESFSALRRSKEIKGDAIAHEPKESAVRKFAAKLPLQMHFSKSRMTTSAIFPFCLGTLVGILAAIMGVGGGFIMVPSMIYILGMPTIVAIGTDLFQIVLTCINVTIQQAIRNHTVDLVLVIFLFIGSTLGAQVGARVSRRLRGEQLRILLAIIVLIVMVKMLIDLLVTPENLISLAREGGGH